METGTIAGRLSVRTPPAEEPRPGMQAGVLRGAVGAPYHKGHLTVERRSRSVAYAGKRAGGGPSYRLRVRPGEPIAPTELRPG